MRKFIAFLAAISLASPAFAGTDPIAQGLAVTALNANGPTKTLTAACSPPSSGSVCIGAQSAAGDPLVSTVSANGIPRSLAQSPWQGNFVNVQGTQSSSMAVSGDYTSTAFTFTGNASTSPAGTNYGTRTRRNIFTSSATSNNYAGFYSTSSDLTVGNGSGLGGFFVDYRFMIQDTGTAPLMFLGMAYGTSAPVPQTDPSTLTNAIGLCVSQSVTTPNDLQICYGGSSAQTPIDLNTACSNTVFVQNNSTTNFYDVAFYSDPYNAGTSIGYTIKLYTSSAIPAATCSGTITGTNGTQLPSATSPTYMGLRAYRSNNLTGDAVTLALASMFAYWNN